MFHDNNSKKMIGENAKKKYKTISNLEIEKYIKEIIKDK